MGIFVSNIKNMTATATNKTNKQATKLSNKLNSGIVIFSYRKANGEVRNAAGTTVSSLMPTAKQPKAGASHETPTTQRYYDLIKQEWRTVKKDEIIRIASTVTV